MKPRRIISILILVCAMFIVGIAWAVNSELQAPADAKISELLISLAQHDESLEGVAPSGGQRVNLQDGAECKNYFLEKGKFLWGWEGLIERALGNPAAFSESFIEEIINCENSTLSGEEFFKNKLKERTSSMVNVAIDLNAQILSYKREMERYAKDQRDLREARSHADVLGTQLYNSEDTRERAVAAFERIYAHQQELVRQMASREVDEEISNAMVRVRFEVEITIADSERILGFPGPPGAQKDERVRFDREVFGTIIDMADLGSKIVFARHVLTVGINASIKELLPTMTISVVSTNSAAPATPDQYMVSSETLREFPELDLVVFDVPVLLPFSGLPLGEIDPFTAPLVSHIYADDNSFVSTRNNFSQLGLINPIPYGISFDNWPNAQDNYMYLVARVQRGDSGSPLVENVNGKTKIVGFVLGGLNDKTGKGVAVKAAMLNDALKKEVSSP